jgi:hypothetical protein
LQPRLKLCEGTYASVVGGLNKPFVGTNALSFTPTVRGTTLWSLINRTRTRVGSDALRERLLNPPHTLEDILALQHAHQVLAADASRYRHTLDQAAADEVEGYLNANWQLPRDMPPLIRLRKWYGEYLQAIERGQTVVTSLLDSAAICADGWPRPTLRFSKSSATRSAR